MSNAQSSTKKRFNNNFGFLRFLGAFLVIFSHSYALTMGSTNLEPLYLLTGNLFSLGALGVAIFFVISGYLITMSWNHHPEALRFLKNRILRIVPGLLGVAIVTMLIIGPLTTVIPISEYFRNPMTLQYLNIVTVFNVDYNLPGVFVNNIYPNAVNGSLWILPLLFKLYIIILAFGLIGLLFKKRFVLLLTLILIFAYLCNSISYLAFTKPFFDIIHYNDFSHFLMIDVSLAAIFFMIGAVYYFYDDIITYDFKIAIFFVFIWILSFKSMFFTMASMLCLPYIIIYIGKNSSYPLNNVDRYGDFSYGLYIYAFPVQQTIAHFFKGISVLEMFLFSSILTILLSYLSLKLIEDNALKLRKVNFTKIFNRYLKVK